MSQKTDNLIKLALVFFVSLLSFSIGTYVGKKYSDNQHKLALLEPKKEISPSHTEEFASESGADMHTDSAASSGSEDFPQNKPVALTDSEVAKIAEEFATEEEDAEEKIVASIEPDEKDIETVTSASKPVAAVKASAPVKTVKSAIEKSGPLPPKVNVAAKSETVDERLPASLPPKTEVTPMHFTVQIGSFPTQEEAEKMTKALQNKGYKTSYVPAKVNGQFWYRVNVGLFGTIREAQDYKKEFLEKTKLTSAIVQRVQ